MVGFPVRATRWYMAQISGRNRPHVPFAARSASDASPATPGSAPPPAPPNPAVPLVNSSPAHIFLKTPCDGDEPATALGNSADARSFQAICGAIASMRWSRAADISAIPPP